MPTPLFHVDAFTDGPFSGNPAAVCLLESARPERWMQAVAAQMNLSETAFLVPRDGGWELRWFTPQAEVALCGHATLASAHVLWQRGDLASGAEARFNTRSGLLVAQRRGALIELDFPAKPAGPCEPPAGLAQALGCELLHVGRNAFDFLVEVESADVVSQLRPNLVELEQLPVRGVIVTARAAAGTGFDFVSRFFAPAVGVPEDPVTGSAHCCLAPFWSERLRKDAMKGRQLSERGGVVHVRNAGDRVMLGGEAVTVLRGELLAA